MPSYRVKDKMMCLPGELQYPTFLSMNGGPQALLVLRCMRSVILYLVGFAFPAPRK
jgi:hypothetical protein